MTEKTEIQSPEASQEPSDRNQLFSWEETPYSYPRIRWRKKFGAKHFNFLSVIFFIIVLLNSTTAGVFLLEPRLLRFEEPLTLKGTVTDVHGNPLQNVIVSIEGTGLIVTTNPKGEYSIRNAPSGVQKIIVNISGFISQKKTVFLVRVLYDSINFKLVRGAGTEELIDESYREYSSWDELKAVFYASTILILTVSLFPLASGIYTKDKKHFSVAVVVVVIGILMPLFMFNGLTFLNVILSLSSFFGLVALVLTLKLRNDFELPVTRRIDLE